MTILGLFYCVILKIWAKYGPKMGQTALRLDGHQHVFPNYLWPSNDHWYFFNSIQVKFYIEVNVYHIQLHNEDWNPKAYCLENHVHIQWAKSLDPLWEVYYEVEEKRVVETAVHTSRQNIHGMGYNWWPQDDNAYHVVSMATRVVQNGLYPSNGHFCREIKVVIYLLTAKLDCQLLHAFLCWLSSMTILEQFYCFILGILLVTTIFWGKIWV